MVTRAAQTGAAGAGMIWRPVSSGTQVNLPGILNFCILHLCYKCLRSRGLVEELIISARVESFRSLKFILNLLLTTAYSIDVLEN